MDLFQKISKSCTRDGIGVDTVGKLIAEASRLQEVRNSSLDSSEVKAIAEEMEIDSAYIEQAERSVRRRKKVAVVIKVCAAIVTVVFVCWAVGTLFGGPSVTEGDDSRFDRELTEMMK